MNMKNRIGKFSVDRSLIETSPEVLMKLMSHCIVVRCELMYDNVFEYVAISPEFDVVPVGQFAPHYHVIVSEPGGILSFKRDTPPVG